MSPASASASVSPPPSRISTGVACEECRRRKSKCDRIRPQCGTCEDIGAACVFPEKRMQRGPKKGQMNALRTRIGECSTSKYPMSVTDDGCVCQLPWKGSYRKINREEEVQERPIPTVHSGG